MTKMRLLLLAAIFLGVILVGVYLTRSGSTKPSPTTPSQNALPSLSRISPELPESLPLTTQPSYDVSTVTIPEQKELPRYTVSAPSTFGSKERAVTIARAFSITTPPIEQAALVGTFYFFTDGERGLSVGPNLTHVDFSDASGITAPPLRDPDGTFVSLARSLVAAVNPAPSDVTILQPRASYFIHDGGHLTEVPRANATIVRLVFPLAIDGRTLFAGYPDESVITATYNGDRRLISFTSPLVPSIQKTKEATLLLSSAEAKQGLIQGVGALVYITSARERDELIAASDYTFSSTKLSTGDLSWFLDVKTKTLFPVFIFSGTAVDKKTGETIQTTTLLPAYAQ